MALGEYLGATSQTKLLYRMDGGATDSSGNANDGTPTNVSWAQGKVGSGSADCNGSNARIASGNVPTSDIGADFTISAVVKPDSFGGFNRIMHYGDNNSGNRHVIDVLHYVGTGIPFVSVQEGGSVSDTYDPAIPALSTTEWTMLTAVKDSSAGKLRFFINGDLVKESNCAFNVNAPSHTQVDVACYYDSALPGYGSFFDGKIDEFVVEGVARSNAYVKKMYSNFRGFNAIL